MLIIVVGAGGQQSILFEQLPGVAHASPAGLQCPQICGGSACCCSLRWSSGRAVSFSSMISADFARLP